MHRALVITCSAASIWVLLAIGCAAQPENDMEHAGYLGEVLPWMLMPAGMRVATLDLQAEPFEEISGWTPWADSTDQVAFGLLPVGEGDDSGVSFLAILGEEPRLIVDTDNDESLSDERFLSPEPINARSFSWYLSVWPEYADGHKAEYPVCITAYYSYSTAEHTWGYSGFCQRRGLFELDGQLYAAAVTSLLSSGTYDDVSELIVAVDSDGDGQINDLPGSHEVFGPGESIQVGGQSFDITHVTADGRHMTFATSGEAAPRPVIARGEPAPAFTAVTTTGESIAFPMDGQVVTILVFVPQIAASSCDGCATNGLSPFEVRLRDIADAVSRFEEYTRILIVAPSCAETIAPAIAEVDATIICDRSVADLYRRTDGVFVIDAAGVIVAMDEAWSKHTGPRPSGRVDQLFVREIIAVVERLLEDCIACD